jgi:hypothetical protein
LSEDKLLIEVEKKHKGKKKKRGPYRKSWRISVKAEN